jgi:alanine racemase
MSEKLSWVEIDSQALVHNTKACKGLLSPKTKLCAVVKANAYGHGIVPCAKIFLDSGVDWLAVHSIEEAQVLRDTGIIAPIYILGYVAFRDLSRIPKLDCRMVVYNIETLDALGKLDDQIYVHIKIETGTHRQGVLLSELPDFIDHLLQYKNIIIEGVSTHFANIEDTTNKAYYEEQLGEFNTAVRILEEKGFTNLMKHCSAAGAALLFPESHFDMVRFGVTLYGMWPSEKLKKTFYEKNSSNDFQLQPAFTWKARIAQIKHIPAGKFVGYGCTYQTDRPTTMAVIPIGYSDGYMRSLSGKSHVLVHGHQAPVLGRVSMNNIVVDVTGLPDAHLEDEVVLLGKQGDAEITSEQFASWADTINYEIPTRVAIGVNMHIERKFLS